MPLSFRWLDWFGFPMCSDVVQAHDRRPSRNAATELIVELLKLRHQSLAIGLIQLRLSNGLINLVDAATLLSQLS